MVRKSGSSILQEELYPPSADSRNGDSRMEDSRAEFARPPVRPDFSREGLSRTRETLDDARLVDLDVDEESPFLRGQKRVSARRGSLPKKTANRLLWAAMAVGVLGLLAVAAGALYEYGQHSWRFRIESSDNIEVTGMQNVTKPQIMEVMGADIGRNIFFIPLSQQKAQLEQIPWVESASVMRFVPNRLKVEIHERTPVAFVRVGPRIALIDAGGTLMELPPKHKYSFPVILGMNPGEPLSTRAPRMKAYNELVEALDSSGARYSQDLSEVDLTDLDNLKVRVNDPAGDVLVELGSSDYLKRYKIYVSHVQEWRQQFQKLESVNLRYDNQVIVNPDIEGRPKQAQLSLSAAKAAAAAGVKQAALTTKINPHDRSLPKPAFELTEKTLAEKNGSKTAARKPAAHVKTKKVKAAAPKKIVAKKADQKAATVATHVPAQHVPAQNPAVQKHVAPAVNAIPKPSPAIAKQQASAN
ncbi:MAG TPA: FtsQ-type POTRA domain-containing protein [Candidatus Solibacter sp.]|nr:FtsQ-type POTRA domain-containing protein [Candidatus Solibacter sp.]